MIQINLQWLALPCWIYAAYQILYGIFAIGSTAGKSDISNDWGRNCI